MAADRIRVGIIGAGFGQAVHVPVFQSHPRCVVTTVCAQRLAKARAVAARYQIPRAVDAWEAIVADPACDAIAIAVPPVLQPTIARAAITAGKHIFCEKPVGVVRREVEAVWTHAQAQGIAHMVDFEFLAIDVWQRAQQLIQQQRIGRIRHVMVAWHVETHVVQRDATSWKASVDEGGGVLYGFGSHVIAYLEWLLGPITRVAAMLDDARVPSSPHETLAGIWLHIGEAVPVSITLSTHAVHGTGHRVEIYGDEGHIVLSNVSSAPVTGCTLAYTPRTGAQEVVTATPSDCQHVEDDRAHAVWRLVDRFTRWIDTGEAQMPSVAEGVRVQCVMDAVREAAATGGWIAVDEATAHVNPASALWNA